MNRKPAVLLAIVAAVVLLCAGAGAGVYFKLVPEIRGAPSKAVEREVAASVQQATSAAIDSGSRTMFGLQLTAQELDINTTTDDSGESGFEITNNDATIYNGVVQIDTNGVEVYLADFWLVAKPSIQDGRFVLDVTDSDRGLTGHLVDPAAIARGMEQGVNAAFADAGLKPTNLSLIPGVLIFTFEATDPIA